MKKEFNLFFIPFILIVKDLNYEVLLLEAEMADDFVTLENIEEIPVRIEYALKRVKRLSDNNPLTGLPGNTSITRA
ncbi:MAG: diguanylate cyclase response regulator, partial [Candidatus Bathyarchaeia archaeon]